jgi:hypothetical protein
MSRVPPRQDLGSIVARLERQVAELSRASRLQNTSLDEGALTITDGAQGQIIAGNTVDNNSGMIVMDADGLRLIYRDDTGKEATTIDLDTDTGTGTFSGRVITDRLDKAGFADMMDGAFRLVSPDPVNPDNAAGRIAGGLTGEGDAYHKGVVLYGPSPTGGQTWKQPRVFLFGSPYGDPNPVSGVANIEGDRVTVLGVSLAQVVAPSVQVGGASGDSTITVVGPTRFVTAAGGAASSDVRLDGTGLQALDNLAPRTLILQPLGGGVRITGDLTVTGNVTAANSGSTGPTGPWTDFTLTTAGSAGINFTNVTAQYNRWRLRDEKTAEFRISIVLGASAITGSVSLGPLPFTAWGSGAAIAQQQVVSGAIYRSTANLFVAEGSVAGTQVSRIYGGSGIVTATAPLTWAAGDILRLAGTVELA